MKVVSIIIFAFIVNLIYAQDVRLLIYDNETNELLPFTTVTIECEDSIAYFTSDINGEIIFRPKSFPLTIKAISTGYTEHVIHLQSEPTKTVFIYMIPNSIELSEISVYGNLVNQTDFGISYNMAANQRAQSENTLQSLSYVPLVNVDADGTISIMGSSNCLIYLNGRPHDMAQTSPKTFLETLPASFIKKVEVITRPSSKFGTNPGMYILNIVLNRPILDGVVINTSGMGSSQPAANGSIMGMIKKNKVNLSLSYDYKLNGQRNQTVEQTYQESDIHDNVINEWNSNSNGNGDWHTHTTRAMFKWEIDSLNSIYADAHGRISITDFSQTTNQLQIFPITEDPNALFLNNSSFTNGAAEANIIYRNYDPENSTVGKFISGYHFTYNPDKRSIAQYKESDKRQPYSPYLQRTNGGMTEHSAMLTYLIQNSPYHSTRITGRELYRRGSTDSDYSLNDIHTSEYAMRYTNNISSLEINYGGWIRQLYITMALTGNFDWFSLKLPKSDYLDYTSRNFYLLPSASLFWRPNNDNALYLNYSTSITRPRVDELNPFVWKTNDFAENTGNPNLKAQYSHDLSLQWYLTRIRDLTLVSSLQYTHITNAILPTFNTENDKLVYSYDNYGRSDQFRFSINANYNATRWLSLSSTIDIGNRWLSSKNQRYNQNDLFCNLTAQSDLYLPNHFKLGLKYGLYTNLPNPNCTRSSIQMYSLNAYKSFFNGQLNVTLSINSLFNKYNHIVYTEHLPTVKSQQHNYITARSFGISLSYSFRSGKKIDLTRDKILNSSDQNTGIQ